MGSLAFDPSRPDASRNIVLKFLDALAEAFMRQELRVISRGKTEGGEVGAGERPPVS